MMVVVAVTVGTGALAIDFAVLFVAQVGQRQPMSRAEMGADGEVSFHIIS
jgi:hypothetical protein